jgi:hypothetical protein
MSSSQNVLKDFKTFQALRASIERSRDNSRSNSRCGTPGPNQVGFLFLQNCEKINHMSQILIVTLFWVISDSDRQLNSEYLKIILIEVILKKQPYLMNERN